MNDTELLKVIRWTLRRLGMDSSRKVAMGDLKKCKLEGELVRKLKATRR